MAGPQNNNSMDSGTVRRCTSSAAVRIFGVLVLGVGLSLRPTSGQTLLAEYVLDSAPPMAATSGFAQTAELGDTRWRATFDWQPAADPWAAVLDPLGQHAHGFSGSLRGMSELGTYQVGGFVDYRYRRSLLSDTGVARSHGFAVGPEFALSPRSRTRIYYRYSVDESGDVAPGFTVPLTEGDAAGAGLAQVWQFADQRGELSLGYEVDEQRDAEDKLLREGQGLNLTGRLPLVWGISASFAADLRRNVYTEYKGATDLESYQRGFSAGVGGKLSERFQADFIYRYADEAAAQQDILSERRRAWGLNLQYKY